MGSARGRPRSRIDLVCVRLSGRVFAANRDREFDLEQEQRPGPGRDTAAPRRGTGRILRDIPSSSWPATALSAAPVPVEVHM